MYANARDVSGIFKPQVRPGLAAVRGPVDAVSGGYVAPNARLSHARVHDVGIGVSDGDGPHGGGPEVAVRDVLPVGAAVFTLPYPAGARPKVEHLRIRRVSGNRHDPSTPVRSDAAPFK